MPPVASGITAVVGRFLLCTIFLMSALGNKIPNFNEVSNLMGKVGVPGRSSCWSARIVFLLVGGFSVLVGYKAKVGAALLPVFLVLATYYFHAFWKATDPQAQQEQMVQFMKNLALMGSMLLIIANGAGPFSFDAKSPRGQAIPR